MIKKINNLIFTTMANPKPYSEDTKLLCEKDSELEKLIYDYEVHESDLFVNFRYLSSIFKGYTNTLKEYQDIISKFLSDNRNENLELLIGKLKQDKKACLVGGSVRDLCLGLEPHDFDFVSSLSYEEIKDLLKDEFTFKETGKQFLVLNVYRNDFTAEIACYRKDGTYTNGRKPDSVEIGTIKEDALRRDFTVNSFYYNLYKGLLIDPNYAIEDLRNKILRFVGDPKKRVNEDYLRIMRFYRFVSKGFKPDVKSLQVCRNMFNTMIKETSPDRIRTELEKIVL